MIKSMDEVRYLSTEQLEDKLRALEVMLERVESWYARRGVKRRIREIKTELERRQNE